MLRKQKTRPAVSAEYSSHFLGLLQFQFHLVSRLSERRAEEEMQQVFGLRLRETRIIGMVGSYGEMPFRILTTHGHFEKGHASRLITALARKGLIRNELNPKDKRANTLRLTSAGKVLYRRISTFASKSNDRWLAVLPKEQHEALSHALTTLMQLLSDAEPEEANAKVRSTSARGPSASRRTATRYGQSKPAAAP
jgi:DNA-binding MarR family transcriptional regulator